LTDTPGASQAQRITRKAGPESLWKKILAWFHRGRRIEDRTTTDANPVERFIVTERAIFLAALDRNDPADRLFTPYGALIGTPEYLSPEQAELSGLDVDTRSDIDSLGVLLYE
jgi:serine/threonine protein kinase